MHDGNRPQVSGAAGHSFSAVKTARPGEPEHVPENVVLVVHSEGKLGIHKTVPTLRPQGVWSGI